MDDDWGPTPTAEKPSPVMSWDPEQGTCIGKGRGRGVVKSVNGFGGGGVNKLMEQLKSTSLADDDGWGAPSTAVKADETVVSDWGMPKAETTAAWDVSAAPSRAPADSTTNWDHSVSSATGGYANGGGGFGAYGGRSGGDRDDGGRGGTRGGGVGGTRGCFKVGAGDKPRENYIPEDEDVTKLFEERIASGVNFDNIFHQAPLQVTGDNVPQYCTSFEETPLRPLLLENIRASGYTKPTPVQRGAIPSILLRRDVMACAQTGSGKTAAYLVPVINILLEMGCGGGLGGHQKQSPEVVIVSPTRELALQIHKESMKFAHNSLLRTVIVYGGTNVQHQIAKVQSGCNILVATPGRLKDLVDRGVLDFASVKFLVLDEADRMLDMGFGADIDFMVKHPTMPPVGKRQTLMFSATFPDDVQGLARRHLHDYIFINTGVIGGTNPDVIQEFHEVPRAKKRDMLMSLLRDIGTARTIIFVESKKMADYVAASLCNNELRATSIHGDRFQRQREEALRDFRRGTMHILVATNVAARGLDIAGVEYVINYDLPSDVEEYVHRIGRTGRVGNVGKSISFFDPQRDFANAPQLVQKLAASMADVPAFLQSAAGGVAYARNAAAAGNGAFASRDTRRFGDRSGRDHGGTVQAPHETEESWD